MKKMTQTTTRLTTQAAGLRAALEDARARVARHARGQNLRELGAWVLLLAEYEARLVGAAEASSR